MAQGALAAAALQQRYRDAVARQQKELALSWKQLAPVDVPLLAALLPTAPELEILDLRHNKLGDEGVAALARGLVRACSSLSVLRIGRNGVADRGGAALAAVPPAPSSTGPLQAP